MDSSLDAGTALSNTTIHLVASYSLNGLPTVTTSALQSHTMDRSSHLVQSVIPLPVSGIRRRDNKSVPPFRTIKHSPWRFHPLEPIASVGDDNKLCIWSLEQIIPPSLLENIAAISSDAYVAVFLPVYLTPWILYHSQQMCPMIPNRTRLKKGFPRLSEGYLCWKAEL
jgi:hypothetical protein